MKVRRAAWWFVPLAIVAAVAWLWVADACRRREARRLVRQYQEQPSEELAHRICRLLDRCALTQAEGESFLQQAFQPRLTLRPCYAAGTITPEFSGFDHPNSPTRFFDDFRGLKPRFTYRYALDGDQQQDFTASPYGSAWFGTGTPSHALTLTEGTHKASLTWDLAVYRPTHKLAWRKWRRIPIPAVIEEEGEPVYSLHAREDSSFLVAISEEVPGVALPPHRDLDAAVRASFSPHQPKLDGPDHGEKLHDMWGGVCVTFTMVPANLAMRTYYRDDLGKETELGFYLASACATGAPHCRPLFPLIEKLPPGQYTGTLILRPAPDLASFDWIEIWGGTIEIPVTFRIVNK